jgi:putative transposase
MTTRDVQAHLGAVYSVDISPELISKITDAVLPELRAWQSRPLDALYPVMYLDAIVVKVRTDGRVTNRPVYIAMGIDLDGCKHVLGMWLGHGDEGAKYWLGVLTELRNRGLLDVMIACCDGLSGFGDAIEAVWPKATVQTCVVHLIRNSVRFTSYKDRRAVVADLKAIYTAPTVDAAAQALDGFEATWGTTYGAIVDLWRRHWDRFIPFLDFDPAIRKIIYTTNAIESLNYQLRKVTKTRGSFPTDDAVLKIFYLAINNIGHHRGGELGTNTQGWKQAINAFAVAYPGRIPDTLS